jgi:hypothetical protein
MKYFCIMLLLLTSCHKNTPESCMQDIKKRLNIEDTRENPLAIIGISVLCNSCKNDPDCVMSEAAKNSH